MSLMPRKLLVQQGTTATPVKTPAEDWRLAEGGLWTPSGTPLVERNGVIVGPAPAGATRPLEVQATAASTFTVKPGRFLVPGAALQGGYVGVVDSDTVRTITGTGNSLPAAGTFKGGYVCVHVYDQVYGDTVDGFDLEILMGAAAATVGAVVYPAVTGTQLALRQFTIDSTGTITLTAAMPNFTVPRGGICPVIAIDNTPGAYVGQYRDHPTYGAQRWDGGTWGPVELGRPVGMIVGTSSSFSIPTTTITNIPLPTARKAYNVDVSVASRIGVQRAGWYMLNGVIQFNGGAGTGVGRRILFYYVNGVAVSGAAAVIYATVANGSAVAGPGFPIQLNAGDYVQLFGQQDSGAAGVVDCTASWLALTYLGA